MGNLGVFNGEVSDGRTAQGGKIGSGIQGCGEVVYQGSDVGAAAAGDLERRRLFGGVEVCEHEPVDFHGTGLAFDADAAAVQLVEAYALSFEGRGHRRYLQQVAGESGERVAESAIRREGGVQIRDVAFCVKRVRNRAETGGGRVGFVQARHVAREAGCAPEQEYEEARGQGIQGSCVPDSGLFRKQTLDPGDRPGASYAGRLVQ